nr:MAG TPA: hypothetical protein [Caudoviricetes sp.]
MQNRLEGNCPHEIILLSALIECPYVIISVKISGLDLRMIQKKFIFPIPLTM